MTIRWSFLVQSIDWNYNKNLFTAKYFIYDRPRKCLEGQSRTNERKVPWSKAWHVHSELCKCCSPEDACCKLQCWLSYRRKPLLWFSCIIREIRLDILSFRSLADIRFFKKFCFDAPSVFKCNNYYHFFLYLEDLNNLLRYFSLEACRLQSTLYAQMVLKSCWLAAYILTYWQTIFHRWM